MALSDFFPRQVKHKGAPAGEKYSDGQGLYILVTAAGKYWRMSYRYLDKQKTLALGVYPTVSLANARKWRDEARTLLAAGTDPSEAKRAAKHAKIIAASHTFESVARTWLTKTATNRAGSTQEKITGWLEKNIFPTLGKLPISSIRPRDVLAVVRKIEARGAIESAHRVKGYCGQIFRFAVACGLAERDVTADLKGALAAIPRTHYAAITEPKEVADLMRAIYAYSGQPCTIAALKLAPLVFVRPGELRSAEWAEIDLERAEWRIPACKMKMRMDHIVPLSTQAVEILRSIHPVSGDGKYVFPGGRTGERCMSENTLNGALRNLGYPKEKMTAHGFRAMARTILDEELEIRVEWIEHQLAHAVKDANGRAYNRTTHLRERRKMMQAWADYLDGLRHSAVIVSLRNGTSG